MIATFLQLVFRLALLGCLVMTGKIFVDHMIKQRSIKNEMNITKIIMKSLPMAIEKYKENHKKYPSKIDDLIPEFFEKIPGVNYKNKIPQKIDNTVLVFKGDDVFPGIEFKYSLDLWNGEFCKVVYDANQGLYTELGDKQFCHNKDLFEMKPKRRVR
ncbi:MAG: hypothetical protein KC646_01690 [Candidatus Cloacimonetes bacterium]|nr:hypothetical protein [Candidatus Cloacimonadota bacterium]